jgi:hypothetical protein
LEQYHHGDRGQCHIEYVQNHHLFVEKKGFLSLNKDAWKWSLLRIWIWTLRSPQFSSGLGGGGFLKYFVGSLGLLSPASRRLRIQIPVNFL